MLFMPIFIFASENNNLKNEDYLKLKKYYDDQAISKLSEEDISMILSEGTSAGKTTAYFRHTYSLDFDGNVVDSYTKQISKEDYLNEEVPTADEVSKARSSCGINCAYYETTYKELTLELTLKQANVFQVDVITNWKKIPAVKHYDIIGYRVETPSTLLTFKTDSTYVAKQIYDGTTAQYSFNSSGNSFVRSNGIAQVMNIVNSTSSSLKMTLRTYLLGDPSGLVVYASYQHSVNSNNTLANMKSATFNIAYPQSPNVQYLGGTFSYANSIANNLDKMTGIYVEFDTDLFN